MLTPAHDLTLCQFCLNRRTWHSTVCGAIQSALADALTRLLDGPRGPFGMRSDLLVGERLGLMAVTEDEYFCRVVSITDAGRAWLSEWLREAA